MTTVIIVQARMGSKRFPGKIMAPFLPGPRGGPRKPVLWHVLRRCKAVKNADLVVLATPDSWDHADAWLLAESLDCHTFTGSEKNVLDRYYQAAKFHEMRPDDLIVRITADCPLINARVADALIELHQKQGADYGSNLLPRTYPKGYDCEVMTFQALKAAWCMSLRAYDKEHVTPWLQRHKGIKRVNLRQIVDQSSINLCVDYPEDVARIELVLKTLGKKGPIRGALQ